MTATVTEHWITVQGLELLVEDQGTGPVVLLAHGMWCDAGMFAALVRELSRDHRVLVPDLRGHGRSTVPDRQWQIADLATDLVALLDALSVPRVLLGGFSMGGMAAAEFALHYPDRLTGLAFMGTSAASEEWIRIAEIRALARLIKLAGRPKFLGHEAARTTFSPAFRRDHPEEVERWVHTVHAMSRTALIHALNAVGSRPSLLERLEGLEVPTVILTGKADKVMNPKWSQAMARRLPRAWLASWEGAGHAIPMERPVEVAAWIRGLERGRFPGDG